jgi:hypothetical protein
VLRAERKKLVGIAAAMVLMAACSPVCGSTVPAPAGWQLTMTGPVAGNLSSGSSNCQVFTGSRRFDYLLGTKMSGKDLVLSLTVYSNFTGPGTYKVGSVLDGSGELRLQLGTYQGFTTTDAGTLAVKTDGKSGTVDSDLTGGEHIKGSWVCDKVETLSD